MAPRLSLAGALLLIAACGESSHSDDSPDGGGVAAATGGSGGIDGTGGATASTGGAPSSGGSSSGGSSSGGSSSGGSSSGGTGGVSTGGTGSSSTGGTGGTSDGDRWRPAPGTSWQWQLSGSLDTSFDVDMYDIDLFDHSAQEIANLQAQGRKVVCYLDTAYEPGRPDSSELEPFRGNPVDGWPGQYWLDLRAPEVLDVMKARIALAESKGCDGVEADDVDHRTNDPGFPITGAIQQGFIRALADETHARGMAFGLKNDLDEIEQLVDVSDFAINEECFEYDECDLLAPFIQAGKAVFQVEYTEGNLATKGASVCPESIALDFDTLIKHLDLDAPRYSCR